MNQTIETAALAELKERAHTAAQDGNIKHFTTLSAVTLIPEARQAWVERFDTRQHNIAVGDWAEVTNEKCPHCGGTLYADACLRYYGGHGNTRQTYCLCGWSVVGRWVELAQSEPLPV